jgi:hypothetical protein
MMQNLQNTLSLKKGYEFQKYVETNLFPFPIYSVDYRTSHYDDSPTLRDKQPDFIFRPNYRKSQRFAIECKYRSNLIICNDIFKVSTLDAYFKFQEQKSIPVFIVLGVGNSPSSPDRIFVFPLRKGVVYPMMYKERIEAFERLNKGVLVFADDMIC